MAGMEENLFPSRRSVEEGKLDEERRLCYVGMTRAKQTLYLTGSAVRTMYSGGTNYNMPSRFLRDIPPEALDNLSPGKPAAKPAAAPPPKPRINFFQAKAEFTPKATASPDASAWAAGWSIPNSAWGRFSRLMGREISVWRASPSPGGEKAVFELCTLENFGLRNAEETRRWRQCSR